MNYLSGIPGGTPTEVLGDDDIAEMLLLYPEARRDLEYALQSLTDEERARVEGIVQQFPGVMLPRPLDETQALPVFAARFSPPVWDPNKIQ